MSKPVHDREATAALRGWVFDLDGTLTIAAHDFDAIRATLDLPADEPILEALDRLPPAEQVPRREELRRIELEIAGRSRPATAVDALLEWIVGRGARVGIVTRNTRENAIVSLRAAGLDAYFDTAEIIGRDEAPAKPSPAGIAGLLSRWSIAPGHAAMIGDFRFDLIAGRRAGTAAYYVDPSGEFPWAEHADRCVRTLGELMANGPG